MAGGADQNDDLPHENSTRADLGSNVAKKHKNQGLGMAKDLRNEQITLKIREH
jgi:hypothetical protein